MSIHNQTFCIYCQLEFQTPKRLKNHVLKEHPDTYASVSLTKSE